MTNAPFFIFGLTGVYVAIILARKAKSASGLRKQLTIGAAIPSAIVGILVLFVFLTQNFTMPGPGLVIIPMTILSVLLWVASLIWTAPAAPEDRLVFIGTVFLMSLMIVSAALVG